MKEGWLFLGSSAMLRGSPRLLSFRSTWMEGPVFFLSTLKLWLLFMFLLRSLSLFDGFLLPLLVFLRVSGSILHSSMVNVYWQSSLSFVKACFMLWKRPTFFRTGLWPIPVCRSLWERWFYWVTRRVLGWLLIERLDWKTEFWIADIWWADIRECWEMWFIFPIEPRLGLACYWKFTCSLYCLSNFCRLTIMLFFFDILPWSPTS